MGNLRDKCPKSEWKLVKALMEKIYDAKSEEEARREVGVFCNEYRSVLPALVACLEKDLDPCLAHMKHPYRRWKHIRTTNIIERCFKEFRRRISHVESYPTEEC